MLVILFGLMGTGKTYLGELLETHLGFYHWDGDNALTQPMIAAIQQGQSFDQTMRDDFTLELIKKINELSIALAGKNLVISQALYKKKNREIIRKHFPEAIFIHVDTNEYTTLHRVMHYRHDINSTYIQTIRANFEPPDPTEEPHIITLKNNVDNNQTFLLTVLAEKLHLTSEFVFDVSADYQALSIYFNEHAMFDNIEEKQLTLTIPSNQPQRSSLTACLEWVEDMFQNIDAWLTEHYHSCHAVDNDVYGTFFSFNEYDKKTKTHQEKYKMYLISRDNQIRILTYDTKESCKQGFIDCVKKIYIDQQRHADDIPALRNKVATINKYYQVFFQPYVHHNKYENIKRETHLIKTFNFNDKPLHETTFFPAIFLRQENPTTSQTIFYLPGTGYTRLLRQTAENEAFKLAIASGCHVFLVYTRLSPEHVHPTALMDALTAYDYLLANKISMDVQVEQIILTGYSSGATTSLRLSYLLMKSGRLLHPAALVLISPSLDFTYLRDNKKSAFVFADRYIKPEFLRPKFGYYLHAIENLEAPIISPIYMDLTSLKALPKITLIMNESDVLFYQQRDFLEKMLQGKVKFNYIQTAELDHSSWLDDQLLFEALLDKMHNDFPTIKKTVPSLSELPIFAYNATDILPFSTQLAEERIKINLFYQHAVLQKKESITVIQDAMTHENCIALQLYAAVFLILSQRTIGVFLGRNNPFLIQIERLKHQKTDINEREYLWIEAVFLSAENKLNNAIRVYSEILKKWPRDILSGLMIEFHCFKLGYPEQLLLVWESIKNIYIQNNIVQVNFPELNHYLASYAYAHALNNNAKKARFYTGLALQLNPHNPLARCVATNAFSRTRKILKAIEYLELYQTTERYYNNFHLALLYLEQDQHKKSVEISRDQIVRANRPHYEFYVTGNAIISWALINYIYAEWKGWAKNHEYNINFIIKKAQDFSTSSQILICVEIQKKTAYKIADEKNLPVNIASFEETEIDSLEKFSTLYGTSSRTEYKKSSSRPLSFSLKNDIHTLFSQGYCFSAEKRGDDKLKIIATMFPRPPNENSLLKSVQDNLKQLETDHPERPQIKQGDMGDSCLLKRSTAFITQMSDGLRIISDEYATGEIEPACRIS